MKPPRPNCSIDVVTRQVCGTSPIINRLAENHEMVVVQDSIDVGDLLPMFHSCKLCDSIVLHPDLTKIISSGF